MLLRTGEHAGVIRGHDFSVAGLDLEVIAAGVTHDASVVETRPAGGLVS